MRKRSITILVTLATLGACSKNNDSTKKREPAPKTGAAESDGSASGSPGVAASPSQPGSPSQPTTPAEPKSWYTIPELGIQVEVPGTPSHSVVFTDVYEVSAPGCTLQIGRVWPSDNSYDDTLAITEGKNYTRKAAESFNRKEKNDDGSFFIEWAWHSKYGQRWYVEDRVKIDGTQFTLFTCSATAMKTAEHAACVSHACATAKKL